MTYICTLILHSGRNLLQLFFKNFHFYMLLILNTQYTLYYNVHNQMTKIEINIYFYFIFSHHPYTNTN